MLFFLITPGVKYCTIMELELIFKFKNSPEIPNFEHEIMFVDKHESKYQHQRDG